MGSKLFKALILLSLPLLAACSGDKEEMSLDVQHITPKPLEVFLKGERGEIPLVSHHRARISDEEGEFNRSVSHKVLSPDGKTIYSASWEGKLRVKGEVEAEMKFSTVWKLPGNLPLGKYKFVIRSALENLSTGKRKQIVDTVEFTIK